MDQSYKSKTFTRTQSKVQFQDQQLDDCILENSVLKSKLQSKIDALSIMGKELDKCSMERDRYKELVEQLQSTRLMTHCVGSTHGNNGSMGMFQPTNTVSGEDLLAKTRDQNHALKLEVETLRSKLEEATADIVALRQDLQKKEAVTLTSGRKAASVSCIHDHEMLVQQLEKVQTKYGQLLQDYRATLDEKEDLAADRDYYKSKTQRLNQQLSVVVSPGGAAPVVDLDAVVMENKYLHERISQLEIEKEIVKRTMIKYKGLLENRNKTDTNFKKGFADVMTQKQLAQFLTRTHGAREVSEVTARQLRGVCAGLVDALNDKTTALSHQRNTNRILANRISELEKTLESWCNGQKYIPVFPSQMLLEEFLCDDRQTTVARVDGRGCDDGGDQRSDDDGDRRSDDDGDRRSDDDGDRSDGDGEQRSDDDVDKSASVNSKDDEKISYDFDGGGMGHTVLPAELQELVKEALAELRAEET